MAHKLFIGKGAIAGGTVLLSALDEAMADEWATGIVSVTLYDDDTYTNAVNATAGTLTITATEDNFNFGTIDNNVIDLTTGAYTRPSFRAYVQDIKLEWAGVTGTGTHFEIRCWRSTD